MDLSDDDDSDSETSFQTTSPTSTEFPFKDIINMIAEHSEASLTELQGLPSRRRLRMVSDDPRTDHPEFVALSTASGVVSMVQEWQVDFRHKDLKRPKKAVRFGEVFKSKVLKPAMHAYKSGDTALHQDASSNPKKAYDWLALPEKHIKVTETDIVYFEELARACHRAISFQELLHQAQNHALLDLANNDKAEKIHRCAKQANKELARLVTCLRCSLTQLRRDNILERCTHLSPQQRSELRHADMIHGTELFPEDLLEEVGVKYSQVLTNRAMQRQLQTGGKSGSGNKNRDQKAKKWDGKSQKRESATSNRGGYQGAQRGANR